MLTGIVIQLPRVYKLSVDVLEIPPALLEAPANNLCLDIVSALGDPHSHSLYGQCFILKLKKNQVDAVTTPLPTRNLLSVTTTGKCRFESEAHAAASMAINLFQHQAACSNRNGARIEWGKTVSDQVGIDEQRTAGFIGQVFQSESRFAGAVWAGNNDYPLLNDFRHLRLSQRQIANF